MAPLGGRGQGNYDTRPPQSKEGLSASHQQLDFWRVSLLGKEARGLAQVVAAAPNSSGNLLTPVHLAVNTSPATLPASVRKGD